MTKGIPKILLFPIFKVDHQWKDIVFPCIWRTLVDKNSVSIFTNTIIHSSVWIQTTLPVWTWYLRVLKYSYMFLWWFSLVKSLEFRLLVFEYLILFNINCVINTNTTLLMRTYYYLAWLEIRSRMKLKFFQIHMPWLKRNNGCYTSWT